MSSEPSVGVNSAFIVEGQSPETPSIVVFSRDDDHALLLGAGSQDLKSIAANELCVTRLEELDMLARRSQARVLRWSSANDLRIYRNLGWDLSGTGCRQCHRFTSDLIPESALNREGICHECYHPVIAFPFEVIRGEQESEIKDRPA